MPPPIQPDMCPAHPPCTPEVRSRPGAAYSQVSASNPAPKSRPSADSRQQCAPQCASAAMPVGLVGKKGAQVRWASLTPTWRGLSRPDAIEGEQAAILQNMVTGDGRDLGPGSGRIGSQRMWGGAHAHSRVRRSVPDLIFHALIDGVSEIAQAEVIAFDHDISSSEPVEVISSGIPFRRAVFAHRCGRVFG